MKTLLAKSLLALAFFLSSCVMFSKHSDYEVSEPQRSENRSIQVSDVNLYLSVADTGWNMYTVGPILPIFPSFGMWSDMHWDENRYVQINIGGYRENGSFEVDATQARLKTMNGKTFAARTVKERLLKIKAELLPEHKKESHILGGTSGMEFEIPYKDAPEFIIDGIQVLIDKKSIVVPPVKYRFEQHNRFSLHFCPCR